jgi:rhodanese-related sulfurtransferase
MSVSLRTVTPHALVAQQAAGRQVVLVDVRSPHEFEAEHARGAHHVPLDRLDPRAVGERLGDPELGRGTPVHFICQAGKRAEQAARRMAESGYPNVAVVAGGTEAWARAGLPTVRGRQVLSLERQVQIALGLLLVLKVVFGFAVHPAFFALVAGVGLGLIWAGATSSCLLSRWLARLPWNRSSAGPATVASGAPAR